MWWLKLRIHHFALSVPLPVYVLRGLLVSLADLCEVILPRFGQPNYAAALYELFVSLADMPKGQPLVAVRTEDVCIQCKRLGRGRDDG